MFKVMELLPLTNPDFLDSRGFFLSQSSPGCYHPILCLSGEGSWCYLEPEAIFLDNISVSSVMQQKGEKWEETEPALPEPFLLRSPFIP